MALPKWNYGIARPSYYTKKLRLRDSFQNEDQIIAQADRNQVRLISL
jgi:hypothetical protein